MAKTLDDLIVDLGNLPQEVKKRINKEELGRALVEKILERVQKNWQGVEKMGDTPKFFKKLAPATIDHRIKQEKKGRLSAETDPYTSNQTETGAMLASLTHRVVPDGIEVYISDPSRQEVYQHQSKDRPWLYFSFEELEYIDETVGRAIDEAFSAFTKVE